MTEKMFMKVIYPSYNISWGHIAQNFWKTRLLFPPPPQRQHVLIRSEGFHKHWWSPWVEKVSVKHLFPRSKMSLCADTNTVKNYVLSPVNHKSYSGDWSWTTPQKLPLLSTLRPGAACWEETKPGFRLTRHVCEIKDNHIKAKVVLAVSPTAHYMSAG